MTNKLPKLEIIKTKVTAKSRALNAKWSFSDLDFYPDPPRKKPETREEEADEIIRRLQAPPVKKRTGFDVKSEIMNTISAAFAQEIDNELLECLKKNPYTKTF